MADGARAGAAAEVQGNDVKLAAVLSEESCDGAGDEFVADAVKAILAQAVTAGNFLVDGVGGDVRGDGVVELGVEAGDVVGAGEAVDAGVDDAEGGAVVQGREVAEGLEVVVGVGGDELGVVVVAAVDDAVGDDADVVGARDLGELGVVDQRFQEQPEGAVLGARITIADLLVLVDRLAAPGVGELGWRRGQAADLGLGDLFRCRIVLG